MGDTKPVPEPIDWAAEAAAKQVVDAGFKIHSALGPGLLEHVYEICLGHELRKRGLSVERQLMLPVVYDGIRMDEGLRIDMLVESCVVVEIKAVESLNAVHKAQLLTYLKLSGHRLGLLINFNTVLFKDGVKEVVL